MQRSLLKQDEYTILFPGSASSCPPNEEITSIEECKKAASFIKHGMMKYPHDILQLEPNTDNHSSNDRPCGCYWWNDQNLVFDDKKHQERSNSSMNSDINGNDNDNDNTNATTIIQKNEYNDIENKKCVKNSKTRLICKKKIHDDYYLLPKGVSSSCPINTETTSISKEDCFDIGNSFITALTDSTRTGAGIPSRIPSRAPTLTHTSSGEMPCGCFLYHDENDGDNGNDGNDGNLANVHYKNNSYTEKAEIECQPNNQTQLICKKDYVEIHNQQLKENCLHLHLQGQWKGPYKWNVEYRKCNDDVNQKWFYHPHEYTITNQFDGRCMEWNRTEDNAFTNLCNGKYNQKWIVNGDFILSGADNTRCLTVHDSSNLVVLPCDEYYGKQWFLLGGDNKHNHKSVGQLAVITTLVVTIICFLFAFLIIKEQKKKVQKQALLRNSLGSRKNQLNEQHDDIHNGEGSSIKSSPAVYIACHKNDALSSITAPSIFTKYPQNLVFDVYPPKGTVGISFDKKKRYGPPVIVKINADSSIANSVETGDILLAVDNEDVSSFTGYLASEMIRTRTDSDRKLTFCKLANHVDVDEMRIDEEDVIDDGNSALSFSEKIPFESDHNDQGSLSNPALSFSEKISFESDHNDQDSLLSNCVQNLSGFSSDLSSGHSFSVSVPPHNLKEEEGDAISIDKDAGIVKIDEHDNKDDDSRIQVEKEDSPKSYHDYDQPSIELDTQE